MRPIPVIAGRRQPGGHPTNANNLQGLGDSLEFVFTPILKLKA